MEHVSSSPDIAAIEAPSLADLESEARARLGEQAWAWLAAVADAGQAARRERSALDAVTLRGRACVDPVGLSTRCSVLGHELGTPVLAAPTTLQSLANPEGEVAMVDGCERAGSLAVVSCGAARTPEEVGQNGAPWWLQLYPLADEGLTTEVIQRAVAAGASAVMVTVDVPVPGQRTGRRAGGSMWLIEEYRERFKAGSGTPFRPLTWGGLDRLRDACPVPLIVKGVLDPHDAQRFATNGVDALVVSTHGGRQFDAVPAPAEVLPAIREVSGSAEVYADGSVRSGTDVLRLFVRGAQAVLVGRPLVWALAVGGAEGVGQTVDAFTAELARAMAFAGVTSLQAVDASIEWS